jgi:hypothetical protein
VTKLQDQPLPRGITALHEAVLLGRALINLTPDALERNVLTDEAWMAAGIPRQGVSVHVEYVHAGRRVDESYVIADRGGGGRHAHQHDPRRGSVHELRVELGLTPCQDRFNRLHAHLRDQLRDAQSAQRAGGRRPNPRAVAWWEFVDAAKETCGTAIRADRARPVLTNISGNLVSEMDTTTEGAPDRVALIAGRLPELADDARRRGQLDVWAASALLIAANVPHRIAAPFSAADHIEQLTRYVLFSLLEMRISPWQAIYGVAQKAVREGFGNVLEEVADELLAQAEQHRDQALDGPIDRDYFSEQLFLGMPKAWTAMHLYRILKDLAPEGEKSHRPKRRTAAEELAVRMQDGIAYQWLDVDDARIAAEWREIHRMQQAGDNAGVRNALREGEARLFWPRAARSLLLGPSPWSNTPEG